jgi:hypothetical protein
MSPAAPSFLTPLTPSPILPRDELGQFYRIAILIFIPELRISNRSVSLERPPAASDKN